MRERLFDSPGQNDPRSVLSQGPRWVGPSRDGRVMVHARDLGLVQEPHDALLVVDHEELADGRRRIATSDRDRLDAVRPGA